MLCFMRQRWLWVVCRSVAQLERVFGTKTAGVP